MIFLKPAMIWSKQRDTHAPILHLELLAGASAANETGLTNVPREEEFADLLDEDLLKIRRFPSKFIVNPPPPKRWIRFPKKKNDPSNKREHEEVSIQAETAVHGENLTNQQTAFSDDDLGLDSWARDFLRLIETEEVLLQIRNSK